MRKNIIAANWKMNLSKDEALNLIKEIISGYNFDTNTDVIVSPPYVYLDQIFQVCKSSKNFYVSAQDCSFNDNGAFTGEISTKILKSCGSDFVIIGHSERRINFKEDDEILKLKIHKVLGDGLRPIFCCGETLNDRNEDLHFKTIMQQISSVLFSLDANDFSKVVIAYEPVWAIGTGKTATKEQAQDMHAFIRKIISQHFGDNVADKISILYGGSCKPSNAHEIFSQKDIDGGLIGGASLKSDSFLELINIINEISRS